MSFLKLTFEEITKKCHFPNSFKDLYEYILFCFPELMQHKIIVEYFDGEDNVRVENDFDLSQAKQFLESSKMICKFTIKRGDKKSNPIEIEQAKETVASRKEEVIIESIAKPKEEKNQPKEFLCPLEEIVSKARDMVCNPNLISYFGEMLDQTKGYTSYHFNIYCFGCAKRGFEGVRYKCSVCDNYDFCETCFSQYGEAHKHEFKIIKDPDMLSKIAQGIVENVLCKADYQEKKSEKTNQVLELSSTNNTAKEYNDAVEDINSVLQESNLKEKEHISNKNEFQYQAQLEYLLTDLGMVNGKLTPEQIHNVLVAVQGDIDEALKILIA